MTTKPKVRKFRIRRSAPGPAMAAQDGNAARNVEDAPQPGPEPETQAGYSGEVASARETGTAQSIDEIRREGLTGRELRMARRMAQKHGLAPTSDFDAVRLLRARGIDPFQRANILELVANKGTGTAPN